MKKTYDDLSVQVSKLTTNKYSTSFSIGILALGKKIRPAIHSIYGYVRLADEIVDSFHGYNKKELLEKFTTETWIAIKDGISLNPILNAFQSVVNQYQIDHNLIRLFLKSMAMDLEPMEYNSEKYKEYIVGSAEVVGLMCLQVFVNGDVTKYNNLKPFAMKLGSAFQKINFLRDLKDDYQVLGRTYFPGVDFSTFNNHVKASIEKEINDEFKEALIGIKLLPNSSKLGVFLAYKYYISLFKKIRRLSANRILNERIRIPNSRKLSLMMSSYVEYKTILR